MKPPTPLAPTGDPADDRLSPRLSRGVNPGSQPAGPLAQTAAPQAAPPRLLDRLRQAIRVRYDSIRTEDAYADWARRFILFHVKRHPADLGAPEVAAFLTHLAVQRNVAASTQNQAKSALLFLDRVVLGGVGTLVVAGPWMTLFPSLARLERLIGDARATVLIDPARRATGSLRAHRPRVRGPPCQRPNLRRRRT